MEKKVVSNNDLNALLASGKYVFLKTYTTWCGPCKMLAKELLLVQEETNRENLIFADCDIDDSPDIKNRFDVSSVPKILILKNNQIVAEHSGFMNKTKIIDFINIHCV